METTTGDAEQATGRAAQMGVGTRSRERAALYCIYRSISS